MEKVASQLRDGCVKTVGRRFLQIVFSRLKYGSQYFGQAEARCSEIYAILRLSSRAIAESPRSNTQETRYVGAMSQELFLGSPCMAALKIIRVDDPKAAFQLQMFADRHRWNSCRECVSDKKLNCVL